MRFRKVQLDSPPEINLIPLIDVLLVILIFLVATTTFEYESIFQISLPQASSTAQPIEAIELLISKEGQIQIGNNRLDIVTSDSLTQALRALTDQKGRDTLLIRADAQAAHQWVILAMQAAKRAGIERVSFAVQADKD